MKWIIGAVGFLATLLAGSSLTKNKSKKKIEKQVKEIDSEIEAIQDSKDAIKITLENKKQVLEEIQKQKFKPTKKSGQEADKFIKDLLKKRRK